MIWRSGISHTERRSGTSLDMFQGFAFCFLISACRVEFLHSPELHTRVPFLEIRAISLADVFWLVFSWKWYFYV